MNCKNNCESCLMPFDKDPGRDTRESSKYCSLCFKDGKLCYEGDLRGFQKIVYSAMLEQGMNKYKARFFTWMIRFAPRWIQ